MSARIYKGFGFIADQKFIDLNSDIDYVRLQNDDRADDYFVGIVLARPLTCEIMRIGGENLEMLKHQYDAFIKDIEDDNTDNELWSDDKTRLAWLKKLKAATPELMVFVA